MTTEAQLITAVCKNKDISTLLEVDVDTLFVSHADIWDSLRNYYFKYKAVPDTSVLEEMYDDFDPVEINGDTKYYLDQLRDEYIKTKLKGVILDKGKRLKDAAGADLLEELQGELYKIARMTNIVRDVDVTDYESAAEHLKSRAERSKAMGGAPGIPTGIKAIDTFYPTGMAPGHMIVLLGWSGRGKSWFGSYLACKAWSAGFSPMIVSLEMSPEEMRDRVYTIMASGLFRNSAFSRGAVDLDAFRRWGEKNLADKHKFIVVSSEGANRVTPTTVQGKIDQHRPDLVILDYHQLFDSDERGGNETVRNRNISREFKLLAVRNAIPVVDITQATQKDGSDTSQPPLIEEVAWSRGIQHDADLGIAVHKHQDSNLFTVLSRKNRHGEEFEFALDWKIDEGVVTEHYGDLQ